MGQVKNINIDKEMKSSFLDYAMSVIVSRALPDVRDGLKPVHRRIIYGMNDLGMHSDKPYKKSARIVGDVMGKYHPHGDSSIYEAMVRLAQDFSTRYMLIQGHGNFGSIDGDGAAAMRYTEARLSKIAMQMVRDIKKNTIDYKENYDGSEMEPVVLPSRVPNILMNGTTGIAVGMATNIPPYNFGEIVNALIAYIDNNEITTAELMTHIKGPDFPTGGVILGRSGIKKAFETGKGSIAVRGKCEIIDINNGRQAIIVTEIPYQVVKSNLVAKIAELVKNKKLDGITDLRDESNRDGIKVVIELRKGTNANVMLNNLYKQTQLQSNFSVNNLALVNNEPKLLNLKETIYYYIEHQVDVVERRTRFDLDKANERLHILAGLLIALDNIDRVIAIIRNSENDSVAMQKLGEEFSLSEIQSKAILDMRLRRLTGLERDKLFNEVKELEEYIKHLEAILVSKESILEVVKTELLEVYDMFADERRSYIDETALEYIDDESLIPQEDIVIILSKSGYVKRTTVDEYRVQNRGGVGTKGMKTNDDDYVQLFISTRTHQNLLFFSDLGKVYRLKGYEVPAYSRQAKGLPIVNLLPIEAHENINAIIAIDVFNPDEYLFFATSNGLIKRTPLSEFSSIRNNGKIAITLKENDVLISVKQTTGENDIILGASNGKSILFEESSIKVSGRTASGIRGIRIDEEDKCIGMAVVEENSEILVISENGYGKRTPIDKYRKQIRGGSGVKTIKSTDKNGSLIGFISIKGDEDILVSSNEGMMIRVSATQISTTGRDALGVRIINLKENEIVSNIAVVEHEEIEEE